MRLGRIPRSLKVLGVVPMLLLLTLAGCGGGGSGSASLPGTGITLTIGSKKDADGQLLAQMYALLLQKQGFTINLKLALGDNKAVDSAIKSGQLDIYPEFNGTAIGNYGLPSTQDPQKAYQEAAAYYESNFKITWLDPALNLNDSYGICTSQANSTSKNLKTLDDLAAQASQLTLAGQTDFTDPNTGVFPPVAAAYGITFKKTVTIDESLGFAAVTSGQVDVNECYTTDPAIVTNNFVLLTDTKNAFPAYNPSPIVRDPVLTKSPSIKTTLNALAPHLTTAKIVQLIKKVSVDGTPVKEVATQFLQSEGLL
jgi:osmoprotectant transport system substrate-binding protein